MARTRYRHVTPGKEIATKRLTTGGEGGFVNLRRGGPARLASARIDPEDRTMKMLDAQTAGRTAPAGVARLRVAGAELGGLDLGMYPCAWRAGVDRVETIPTAIFANATSHKAWRPKEPFS
jgi:hypothetical protein